MQNSSTFSFGCFPDNPWRSPNSLLTDNKADYICFWLFLDYANMTLSVPPFLCCAIVHSCLAAVVIKLVIILVGSHQHAWFCSPLLLLALYTNNSHIQGFRVRRPLIHLAQYWLILLASDFCPEYRLRIKTIRCWATLISFKTSYSFSKIYDLSP